MKCNICPRECLVDRDSGQLGACGVTNEIYVARISLHMWEEPCISGVEGSGAVFFVGCNLGCIYCQNYEISHGRSNNRSCTLLPGKKYTLDGLADSFVELQNMGANNINLVTPTHYSMQIIDAVKLARNRGLTIPIVYNCSGYEKVETLKLLKDVVDIYLTDFKYMNSEIAKRYSRAENYAEIAKFALDEMVKQKPQPEFDDRGIMTRGVIVRNLLLPGNVKKSKEVVKYVHETYGNRVYISIMNQYTPLSQVKEIEPLNRKVTKREYDRLVEYAMSMGIENAFIQEGDVASESFIPEFGFSEAD